MTKQYPPWIYLSYDGHDYVVMTKDEHSNIMMGSIEGNINFMKATEGKWIIHDNTLYIILRELIEKAKPEEFTVKGKTTQDKHKKRSN